MSTKKRERERERDSVERCKKEMASCKSRATSSKALKYLIRVELVVVSASRKVQEEIFRFSYGESATQSATKENARYKERKYTHRRRESFKNRCSCALSSLPSFSSFFFPSSRRSMTTFPIPSLSPRRRNRSSRRKPSRVGTNITSGFERDG